MAVNLTGLRVDSLLEGAASTSHHIKHQCRGIETRMRSRTLGFQVKVYACLARCCEAGVNIWTTSTKDRIYRCVSVLGIRTLFQVDRAKQVEEDVLILYLIPILWLCCRHAFIVCFNYVICDEQNCHNEHVELITWKLSVYAALFIVI